MYTIHNVRLKMDAEYRAVKVLRNGANIQF